MASAWLFQRDAFFSLYSLTLAASYRASAQCVPAHTLRLLCPISGACYIHVTGERIHLLGNRVLLLAGELAYTMADASDDFLISELDITVGECTDPVYPPFMLYQHHGCYYAYCQANPSALAFEDSFGLVPTIIGALNQYAQFPVAQRRLRMENALSFLMLYATFSAYDTHGTDVYCSRYTRQAIRYIHDNYMTPITTGDIAGYIGIHPNYLHRLFAKEMGTQPAKYLTQLRIEKAKVLLGDTNIPIAEIARRVGIANRQHFSKVFHAQVGVAPAAYRRSYNLTCNYTIALEFLEFAYSGKKREVEGL